MTTTPDQLPIAEIRPERRLTIVWIIPIIALALAGWLGWQTWSSHGLIVTVELEHGHGLEEGATLRCRDVAIGEVRSLALSQTGDSVVATIAIDRRSAYVAQSGSRFWVVRPQLGLDHIAGLDTIIGARYLEVVPGDGPPLRRFTALAEPPVVTARHDGDLEISLSVDQRSGIRRGAPVTYRQIRVGTVLSVGLTSDGGAVNIRAHIEQPYVALITRNTQFWPVSGVKADASLTGFELEIDSLETILAGGVALATPPDAGPPVRTGHRFKMVNQPDKDWLEWTPQVVIGSAMLPPGTPLAAPLRSTLNWEENRIGGLLTSDKRTHGWLLLVDTPDTDDSLLYGPTDALAAEDANDEKIWLDVAGARLDVTDAISMNNNLIAAVPASLDNVRPWPHALTRRPEAPEDCIVVTNASLSPTPIAADRFTAAGDSWVIDESLSLDQSLHGGIVVARADGFVIGIILCDEDRDEDDHRVALLP